MGPGCVRAERDVAPTTEAGDTARVRSTLDDSVGCDVLSQSVIEFAPGRSQPRNTGDCEEVLFVLSGEGELLLDGSSHRLEPEAGAYLAPGERYEIDNPGDAALKVVAVFRPAGSPAAAYYPDGTPAYQAAASE